MICVLLLDRSEKIYIQKILTWIPAILFAYIIPAIFTQLFSLDLSSVKLHAVSKDFIMPLAVISVMSALSFKQLKAVGIKPILVFFSGSFAVAVLPLFLLWFLSFFTPLFSEILIDQAYWKGLVTMVGSWIGGSTSQLILRELSGCPEGIFLIILVMDNVLVNLWTIGMFQKIKRSKALNKLLKISDEKEDFIKDEVVIQDNRLGSIALTIGLCVVPVILAYFFVEQFLLKIIILSILGLLFGNFIPFWNHSLVIKIGGYFILGIMAILGLKLNFANFELPGLLVLFAVIWLILHYVVMLVVAYFLKLNMAWVPIASMANVGGISTAPAVTKAYHEEWMPHAILLSILSMVTGTYWGMLSIYLFETLY